MGAYVCLQYAFRALYSRILAPARQRNKVRARVHKCHARPGSAGARRNAGARATTSARQAYHLLSCTRCNRWMPWLSRLRTSSNADTANNANVSDTRKPLSCRNQRAGNALLPPAYVEDAYGFTRVLRYGNADRLAVATAPVNLLFGVCMERGSA